VTAFLQASTLISSAWSHSITITVNSDFHSGGADQVSRLVNKYPCTCIIQIHINGIKIYSTATSTTINEPIMVCDLYEMKVAEYIKQALIESLKEETTHGEFFRSIRAI